MKGVARAADAKVEAVRDVVVKDVVVKDVVVKDVVVKDVAGAARAEAVVMAAARKVAAGIEVQSLRAAAMIRDATALRAVKKKRVALRSSLLLAMQGNRSTGTTSLGISRSSNPTKRLKRISSTRRPTSWSRTFRGSARARPSREPNPGSGLAVDVDADVVDDRVRASAAVSDRRHANRAAPRRPSAMSSRHLMMSLSSTKPVPVPICRASSMPSSTT